MSEKIKFLIHSRDFIFVLLLETWLCALYVFVGNEFTLTQQLVIVRMFHTCNTYFIIIFKLTRLIGVYSVQMSNLAPKEPQAIFVMKIISSLPVRFVYKLHAQLLISRRHANKPFSDSCCHYTEALTIC